MLMKIIGVNESERKEKTSARDGSDECPSSRGVICCGTAIPIKSIGTGLGRDRSRAGPMFGLRESETPVPLSNDNMTARTLVLDSSD